MERRTRELWLPPGEVAFLLTHARHLIDVVPAFRGGFYRVTPRGFVGWFDTPGRRFAIRPKMAWPSLRLLLGFPPAEHPEQSQVEPGSGLLNLVAAEFAGRLAEVVRVGLVAGYHDSDTEGAFLRGKLRPADQLRDAAARAFPDRFHVSESVLDLDTPWNRIPRAIAEMLLACPELAPAVRIRLRDATISLDGVSNSPIAETDFAAAAAEPRTAHYHPLLAVCRLVHDGFGAARLADCGSGAFLLDLSRAFEGYLTDALTSASARHAGWSVEAQPRFAIGITELQPDILIRRRGAARVVLDAKWKASRNPEVADVHQVIAYAAITGARHVGLVYPGRRLARREFPLPVSDIRLSLFRVPALGAETDGRWAARLVRFLRRGETR